jgi:deoxyxylulose-5-phosphate synthase
MENLALSSRSSFSPVAHASSYGESLVTLAAERAELVVMAAQSPAPLRGVREALGKRFIDVGLCDETLIGAAARLALRGRTPVVHANASVLTQPGVRAGAQRGRRAEAARDTRRLRAALPRCDRRR